MTIVQEQLARIYSTAEVAQRAGIHRDTLLRWLREGKVREPKRDARGWRVFTEAEATTIANRLYVEAGVADTSPQELGFVQGICRLQELDWDFASAKTDYLTHGLHPYPAKYIPQIPNALIQELSSVEETVVDIFCGSGTTLVEALTLKRHVIGIDANPLACLVSEAKTTRLTEEEQVHLRAMVERAQVAAENLASVGADSLFQGTGFTTSSPRPQDESLLIWFDSFVVEELAEILSWCRGLPTHSTRTVASAAFSAIVVAVSKQDSDTRYVCRDKNLKPGDTLKRFARSLAMAMHGVVEFGEVAEARFNCKIINASVLDRPDVGIVDAVVCSPPYPNAWSYHLYHRTRMMWLGMDQPKFKIAEIGSHRKYSRKQPTVEKVDMFRREMAILFKWLRSHLRASRYAAFVIGDSIIDGIIVSNADLLAEVASKFGFREIARIDRTIQSTKKAFNPKIGKIKEEQILILQNRQGTRK
jgi:site-specific DNA-methyltransferase (cytosine-N4-specific)